MMCNNMEDVEQLREALHEAHVRCIQLEEIVDVARTFNAHFMHTETGAPGTSKRKEWEQKAEILGVLLNAALAGGRTRENNDEK